MWLNIPFYPPQNQTTDTLRRTGRACMPGPVIIEQNLASGASCESDGRLPDRGKLDRAMQDAVEEVYRLQFLGHRIAPYAAMAAV